MRYFRVWLDKSVPGCEPSEIVVEVEDREDEADVCGDALSVMIENELDTGWEEISAAEAERARRGGSNG